ncbi:MAG: MarR family winged helix-turn-helix transcriptional regulator [Bosea sp. (in: a-proteobacteria)]
MPGSKEETGLFSLFNEIGIIAQLSQTIFERVMPPGMTLAQFTVLNHFVRLGGQRSPAALAAAFQVTRATMTSTLQRLGAKNLILVQPDPSDGRGKLVTLTPAGKAVREQCIAALQPEMDRIRHHPEIVDAIATLPQLIALRRALDEARETGLEAGAKGQSQ